MHYRVVHEAPHLPGCPAARDPGAGRVTEEPALRPDVSRSWRPAHCRPLDGTVAGDTALGPTLTDRTEVVPTIVALGWGVDALPARPDGRLRRLRATMVRRWSRSAGRPGGRGPGGDPARRLSPTAGRPEAGSGRRAAAARARSPPSGTPAGDHTARSPAAALPGDVGRRSGGVREP